MKFLLPLFACLLLQTAVIAQCSEFELATLQSFQRADESNKESQILGRGFDVHRQFVIAGHTYRRYDKCWVTTVGNTALYEQVVLWDATNNTITVAMMDEAKFKKLRSAIEERPSSPKPSGSDVYIGKMFRYQFIQQQIDGQDYYAVCISFKA